ncbi:hypothetical protein DIURU_004124 [Diutina rugosa]|uniref:4-hydroxy-3-methoxy-5-polyprenylbenzoate decarboxylase n=1 Tax=Diutina rugosa TaxID=5481 RepID=A0A642UN11_DIURU|nr:uncharacterized protein DIURU_004124 [Diutina rugosa]KAA8899867.1 hypothetical protein DIURU_004124 [Diutina rugosa]
MVASPLCNGTLHSLTRVSHCQLSQRRHFVGAVVTTVLGALAFNQSNRLADKMEKGKLHYHDANAEFNQQNPNTRQFFTRDEPHYEGHVPLSKLEQAGMIVGSSIGSYFHPERNEFIVGLGESTAFSFVLKRIRNEMLSDPVGRQILRERPRITSDSLDLDYLRSLPENSLGHTYVKWLDREGVSPDTRVPVRYIDDEELAYVFQRYRECHDFYHAITGLPIIIEGEIAVKVLEFMNIGMPMPGLGALFAPLRLKPSQRERLRNIYYPWAMTSGLNSKPLMNVYWEKVLERDVDELRDELGLERPPDLRNLRKEYFAKLKAQRKVIE